MGSDIGPVVETVLVEVLELEEDEVLVELEVVELRLLDELVVVVVDDDDEVLELVLPQLTYAHTG